MDYVIIRYYTEFEGKQTQQILYSIHDEMHDSLFETIFQIPIATYCMSVDVANFELLHQTSRKLGDVARGKRRFPVCFGSIAVADGT